MSNAKLGTAVITGASSGIGAVYADRLARRGYDLLLVARRADRLESLAKDLKGRYGVQVGVEVADLGKAADLARVGAKIAADENVTVLVNNAGINRIVGPTKGTVADAHEVIAVNLSAPTELTLAVLPAFVKRNRGAVIQVASVLALASLPGFSVYTGTKAFILGFSQALQAELAGTDVQLQVVLPAATRTDIWTEEELKNINPASLMEVDDLVDAALVGFDRKEAVTIPPLHDEKLFEAYEAARIKTFQNVHNSKPADRYTSKV